MHPFQLRLVGLLSALWLVGHPGVEVLAQPSCTVELTGQVVDSLTQQPLVFAAVALEPQQTGVETDERGYFHITVPCTKTCQLTVSLLGYDSKQLTLTLPLTQPVRIALAPGLIRLDQVVVKGASHSAVGLQPREWLEGASLDGSRALGLGESLKQLAGVSALHTGATIAKPIIQGLHSNRILIINNGIRLEGQQWGNEHAPEVDPFNAERITVVKGASSLRYGGDALGGAIFLEPRPLETAAGWGGEAFLQGFSNGQMGIAAGMLEGALGKRLPLSARIQGTLKRSGNLHTPDYFLRNTGVAESNFSWTLKWQPGTSTIETFYSRFATNLGILADAHIGNTTDLLQAIARQRPLEDGRFTYAINRPRQNIIHEIFRTKGSWQLGSNYRLIAQYSRQFNRREELDAHRSFGNLPQDNNTPQIKFEITTHSGEVIVEGQQGYWKNTAGVTTQFQNNTTDRGALIPNYSSANLGLFWITQWRKPDQNWAWEIGGRYDWRTLEVTTQGNQVIDENRSFANWAATMGATWRPVAAWALRWNTGITWRAPHVSELYSDGVHHGSASYELGDPNLVPERAINTNLSWELDGATRWSATITGYLNQINDFIYPEPQPEPQLTIRGAFPSFAYRQARVQLTGLDWTLGWQLGQRWELGSKGALVQGWNHDLNTFLIFLPPVRLDHSLKYALGPKGFKPRSPYLKLSMVQVLRQTWAPEGVDFAPTPAGYTRWDAELFLPLRIGKQPVELGASVNNIFQAEYREYLNRLRYFAAETGTNIGLRLKLLLGRNRPES